MSKEYFEYVKAVANKTIDSLESIYNDLCKDGALDKSSTAFDDEWATHDQIEIEANSFAKDNNWYGKVLNRYGREEIDITFEVAQMIAGASPSIEKSYDGRYRKDMFRDIAMNAFYNDVFIEIQKQHPETECWDFCSRSA